MANDLLIAAIRESGLDLNEISAIAEVDPRTVQRWLGGRVPHPRYRQKLTAALHVTEADLWPDAVTLRHTSDLEEIAGVWARADDHDATDWRALLRAAEQQVDLLGYSLHQILQARAVNKQLLAKARDGCQIRIAIADPDAEHVLVEDLAQRPAGRLTHQIRAAKEQLSSHLAEHGIQCRRHHVATSHTILRFDEHILLTVHLNATPGVHAPLLHLRRKRDYGIFDQLAKHFEDVWADARPIRATPEEPAPNKPTVSDPTDKMLDELDYVWRPEH
jgi:lambda repressor-like predicted transcriptional regulator